jgi:hypothetical protein
MTWHYNIIETKIKGFPTYYQIHEVYHDVCRKGDRISYTDAITPIGDTPEELITVLRMMLKDAKHRVVLKPKGKTLVPIK